MLRGEDARIAALIKKQRQFFAWVLKDWLGKTLLQHHLGYEFKDRQPLVARRDDIPQIFEKDSSWFKMQTLRLDPPFSTLQRS